MRGQILCLLLLLPALVGADEAEKKSILSKDPQRSTYRIEQEITVEREGVRQRIRIRDRDNDVVLEMDVIGPIVGDGDPGMKLRIRF